MQRWIEREGGRKIDRVERSSGVSGSLCAWAGGWLTDEYVITTTTTLLLLLLDPYVYNMQIMDSLDEEEDGGQRRGSQISRLFLRHEDEEEEEEVLYLVQSESVSDSVSQRMWK